MKHLSERLVETQRKHRAASADLEEEKKLKVERMNAMTVSPAAAEGTPDTVKGLRYWEFSAGSFTDKREQDHGCLCD